MIDSKLNDCFDDIFEENSAVSPINDPVEIHSDVKLEDYPLIPSYMVSDSHNSNLDSPKADCAYFRPVPGSSNDSLISLLSSGRRLNDSSATWTKKKRRLPAQPKTLAPLPADFQPTPYTVLCARGADAYNSIGKFPE